MDCHGCGQPAKFALTWETQGGTTLRMAYCDSHDCIHQLLGASISASQDGPIRLSYTAVRPR